ncbi:hypothetical protein Dimus_035571 [Dionaea muscipula]
MPRNSRIGTERRKIGGHCKFRKRGCTSSSSSSSSSSLVKNYRFKTAILVGRRAGSSTPVPTWKMTSRSPVSGMQSNGEALKCKGSGGKGKDSLLSARKLAATLWEINGGRSPERVTERERESEEKSGKLYDSESLQRMGDGSKPGSQRRRSSVSSQKLQLTEYIATEADSVADDFLIESTSYATVEKNMASVKRRMKDVRNSLTTTKELVKVLYRMWSTKEEGKHSSSRLTLVSALRVELDRARLELDQVIQEQRFCHSEVHGLLKQFAAEKGARKCKEQERIREAISELETEKRMRRQAERLNKKLGGELAEVRGNLAKATKELDRERRAREILEQTCDELAIGIGENKEEAEELMRESAKAREEVEKERQMLQLADVLREERVQMKLAEARYEFEEKTEALERLRSELEDYFGNPGKSRENEDGDDGSYADFLKKMLGSCQNGHTEEEHRDGGVEGGGGGEQSEEDSELHSIELNMELDKNKFYKWGFGCDDRSSAQGGDSRRPSVEEVFKGRKSLCEKIQWENICLYKNLSVSDSAGKPSSLAVCPEGEINRCCEDEVKKQRSGSGKTLKDHMYPPSSRGGASRQGSLSPAALESSVATRAS